MKYFLIFSFSLFFSISFLSCASRARPGGGPVDKTAPFVVYTIPAVDTTNISNLSEIQILFSERMNESSVNQSVFISPPVEFESDWSGGDELTLNFKEDLRSDQTYVITIGSAAQDLRSNRMEKSFELAFSTGPVIDRGKISGRIFGVNQQDIYYVYAYKIEDPDSLDPTRIRADYLTQPDNKNGFSFGYLANGKYRIFVVEDQNKNLLLDADYERIGIPFSDIKIDSLNNTFYPLNFVITRVDTAAPLISGIRPLNRKMLLLRCSEPLISFDTTQIIITDTLNGRKLEILGMSPTRESSNQYMLYTAEQDSASGYRVKLDAVTDTSGNIGNPAVLDYISSANRDTTGFRLVSVTPQDSAKNVNVDNTITLEFSLAVDTSTVENSFICKNGSGDTLLLSWNWTELKIAVIRPPGNFQPDNVYKFELGTEKIRSLWGASLPDTLITRTFFMKSADEFGTISGKIDYRGIHDIYPYIYVNSLQRKSQIQIMGNSDYSFSYEWIPEGNYMIGGFIDLDRDQKLSAGKFIPFTFSEPFHFNEDTIRVRKRWEFSDVILKIPEKMKD